MCSFVEHRFSPVATYCAGNAPLLYIYLLPSDSQGRMEKHWSDDEHLWRNKPFLHLSFPFILHAAFSTTPTSVAGFDNTEALHSCMSSPCPLHLYLSSHQNKDCGFCGEARTVIYDPLAVGRRYALTNIRRDCRDVPTWSRSSVRHQRRPERAGPTHNSLSVVPPQQEIPLKTNKLWSEFKAAVANQSAQRRRTLKNTPISITGASEALVQRLLCDVFWSSRRLPASDAHTAGFRTNSEAVRPEERDLQSDDLSRISPCALLKLVFRCCQFQTILEKINIYMYSWGTWPWVDHTRVEILKVEFNMRGKISINTTSKQLKQNWKRLVVRNYWEIGWCANIYTCEINFTLLI